jgi:hypothetical protein
VSRNETSERFLKIAFYIALGCGTATFFLSQKALDPELGFWTLQNPLLILVGTLFGFGLYSFAPNQRVLRIVGFFLCCLAPMPLFIHFGFFKSINFILSAALIGSVFSGQFLGHWYLNVPNLNIRELKNIVKILQWSVLLKSLELVITLFFRIGLQALPRQIDEMGRPLGLDLTQIKNLENIHISEGLFSLEGDVAFGLGTFGLLLLLTRVLWGILAPLILARMVQKTVDIRATQSATGILYALCVMIIVGEGCAIYLKLVLNYLL